MALHVAFWIHKFAPDQVLAMRGTCRITTTLLFAYTLNVNIRRGFRDHQRVWDGRGRRTMRRIKGSRTRDSVDRLMFDG